MLLRFSVDWLSHYGNYVLFVYVGRRVERSHRDTVDHIYWRPFNFLEYAGIFVFYRMGKNIQDRYSSLTGISSLLIWFLFLQPLVLILSYGLLFGVGASLVYVPSLAIIGHYYKRYIGIANGIVTVGSSIFSMAMPFILGELLNAVGLQACLRYPVHSIYFFMSALSL